jgi:3-hydroxymyristoyl/3-hydroxydecanoyl-(acyl carrier protein) dehydratase
MTQANLHSWAKSLTEPKILSEKISPEEVELILFLPAELFQFQGHFPDQPILPGVAQLDWAARFSEKYFVHSGRYRKLGQLKFSKLIEAGQTVSLKLRFLKDKRRIYFSYAFETEACSSGFLELAEE